MGPVGKKQGFVFNLDFSIQLLRGFTVGVFTISRPNLSRTWLAVLQMGLSFGIAHVGGYELHVGRKFLPRDHVMSYITVGLTRECPFHAKRVEFLKEENMGVDFRGSAVGMRMEIMLLIQNQWFSCVALI